MHRIGVYALMVGAVLVSIGLLAGSRIVVSAATTIRPVLLLGAVPFGFLIGFAGVVTTLLSGLTSTADGQSARNRPPDRFVRVPACSRRPARPHQTVRPA